MVFKVDKLQVLDGLIPSDTHLPAYFSYKHPFPLSQAEFFGVYVMPSFFATLIFFFFKQYVS